METVIVTLTVLLFITGISGDCTVSTAINISGTGGSCSLSQQTITNNAEVTSCSVTCKCKGQSLECCLGSACTPVDASCTSIQVNNGAISCVLNRKRRDVLSQVLKRVKRSEETTTTEDRIVVDFTTSPPTTTTTAAAPPVRT
ncbi:uncharacterized protein LOC124138374 [Haliotis rufescens]|uniref:uncharacterized protein LOC124138374 n=1 Tax=Haliotis rufescens TaxID=6454 RepID=UPI001EAF9B67|nr:uncharacterized protein LOC124138374 [Haliotis rufescens]